jgi:hypothetical protein
MNRKKKALGQGRDAYQCGGELCANPYLPIDGNPKRRGAACAWLLGWSLAHADEYIRFLSVGSARRRDGSRPSELQISSTSRRS